MRRKGFSNIALFAFVALLLATAAGYYRELELVDELFNLFEYDDFHTIAFVIPRL